MNSLGVLISDPPDSRPFRTGLAEASNALARGEWVGMYLLDEAAPGVGDQKLMALQKNGLHLFACSQAARLFGVSLKPDVVFGGLSLLGELLAKVSCFIHPNSLAPNPRPFKLASAINHRRVLILVTSDPRTSHKPAESIRTGLGLDAWKQVEINFCFARQSTRVFAEDCTDLKGEEVLERHMPALWEWPRPIYLAEPATPPEKTGKGRQFVILTATEQDQIESEHDIILHL